VGYAWKSLDQSSEVMEVGQFNWRYGAYFSELFYEKYLKILRYTILRRTLHEEIKYFISITG
jgi:hypothetical protein